MYFEASLQAPKGFNFEQRKDTAKFPVPQHPLFATSNPVKQSSYYICTVSRCGCRLKKKKLKRISLVLYLIEKGC